MLYFHVLVLVQSKVRDRIYKTIQSQSALIMQITNLVIIHYGMVFITSILFNLDALHFL